jgi:hypothetical protein
MAASHGVWEGLDAVFPRGSGGKTRRFGKQEAEMFK